MSDTTTGKTVAHATRERAVEVAVHSTEMEGLAVTPATRGECVNALTCERFGVIHKEHEIPGPNREGGKPDQAGNEAP